MTRVIHETLEILETYKIHAPVIAVLRPIMTTTNVFLGDTIRQMGVHQAVEMIVDILGIVIQQERTIGPETLTEIETRVPTEIDHRRGLIHENATQESVHLERQLLAMLRTTVHLDN